MYPLLAALLLASVAGFLGTLWLLREILVPIELTAEALRAYLESRKLPDLPVHFPDQAGRLMEGTQYTLTQLNETINRLERVSNSDDLTGIYNRRAGDKRLTEEIARAERDLETFHVAFFDLNGFKDINARHGHSAGDACISHMAALLQLNTPRRLGGPLGRRRVHRGPAPQPRPQDGHGAHRGRHRGEPDTILVKPGERIPMDGRIAAGHSGVNQAPITGESLPVDKAPGSEVFAGTINGEGALSIEVTHLAQDNTISRLIRMVEEAQEQRAPVQRLVDRFAEVYTPAVMVLAALVAGLLPLLSATPFLSTPDGQTGSLYRALAPLVEACPCALVISTPVSLISAISAAARRGVLVKRGA